MKLNRRLAIAVTAVALTLGATLIAQNPGVNVSGKRHPNLNAAQRLLEQAIAKTSDAQQANEFDMGGHAARAKQLMDQADAEIKQAAEAANHR